MSDFFGRDMSVQVGDLGISAIDQEGFAQPLLKMKFRVAASVTQTPNKAKLQIWNLAENNRTKVQKRGLPVVIEAGYVGFTRILYRGDVRFSSTVRQGSAWVTTINAGDGTTRYKTARINENFAGGVGIGEVLKRAGKALGLDLGNLQKKVDAGSKRIDLTEWTNGGVLSGKASDIMSEVAKSMGYQWSIQKGALLLLEEKETTEDDAILLNRSTGLVGSPDVGETRKVSFSSLLNGDIFPGRKIQLESKQINGLYRTDMVTHTGDTWGSEWNSDMEGRPLG